MERSFINILKQSNNELLKSEAAGLELFKGLKHNKEDLELLLRNAIVEVLTTSKKHLICTSNEELVKKFSPIKESGATIDRVMRLPFKTSPKHNTLTWDLIKNKYASIAGNGWQILNFIPIQEKNIDILHRAILDALKK